MTAGSDQTDLLSDLTDLDFVRHLLAEMHDDFHGQVSRFRMLTDIGREMEPNGTMIFGGYAAQRAWVEARSSFVHGNLSPLFSFARGSPSIYWRRIFMPA